MQNRNFQNILVTGASSPIGRSLALQLRYDYPTAHITGLARSLVGLPYDRSIQIDLAGPIPIIRAEFDLVVHASVANLASGLSPADIEHVNLYGSVNLFENLCLSSECTVLNLSTVSVYDAPLEQELVEGSKKSSIQGLGRSKLDFENFLHRSFFRQGMTLLSLRIPVLLLQNVRHNFISKWIFSIKNSEELTLFNPGSMFNLTVDDLSIYRFAKVFFCLHKNRSLVCNLSTHSPISILSTAKIVIGFSGKKVKIIEKKSKKPAQLMSCSLAERYGYRPLSTVECISEFSKKSFSGAGRYFD